MLIRATPHKRRVGGSRKNNTSVHNLDAARHRVETTTQKFKSLLGAVTLSVGVLRRKTVAIEGSLNPGRERQFATEWAVCGRSRQIDCFVTLRARGIIAPCSLNGISVLCSWHLRLVLMEFSCFMSWVGATKLMKPPLDILESPASPLLPYSTSNSGGYQPSKLTSFTKKNTKPRYEQSRR